MHNDYMDIQNETDFNQKVFSKVLIYVNYVS